MNKQQHIQPIDNYIHSQLHPQVQQLQQRVKSTRVNISLHQQPLLPNAPHNQSLASRRRFSPSIVGTSKFFPKDFFANQACQQNANLSILAISDPTKYQFKTIDSRANQPSSMHSRKINSSQLPTRINIQSDLSTVVGTKPKVSANQLNTTLRDISNIISNNGNLNLMIRKQRTLEQDEQINKLRDKSRTNVEIQKLTIRKGSDITIDSENQENIVLIKKNKPSILQLGQKRMKLKSAVNRYGSLKTLANQDFTQLANQNINVKHQANTECHNSQTSVAQSSGDDYKNFLQQQNNQSSIKTDENNQLIISKINQSRYKRMKQQEGKKGETSNETALIFEKAKIQMNDSKQFRRKFSLQKHNQNLNFQINNTICVEDQNPQAEIIDAEHQQKHSSQNVELIDPLIAINQTNSEIMPLNFDSITPSFTDNNQDQVKSLNTNNLQLTFSNEQIQNTQISQPILRRTRNSAALQNKSAREQYNSSHHNKVASTNETKPFSNLTQLSMQKNSSNKSLSNKLVLKIPQSIIIKPHLSNDKDQVITFRNVDDKSTNASSSIQQSNSNSYRQVPTQKKKSTKCPKPQNQNNYSPADQTSGIFTYQHSVEDSKGKEETFALATEPDTLTKDDYRKFFYNNSGEKEQIISLKNSQVSQASSQKSKFQQTADFNRFIGQSPQFPVNEFENPYEDQQNLDKKGFITFMNNFYS